MVVPHAGHGAQEALPGGDPGEDRGGIGAIRQQAKHRCDNRLSTRVARLALARQHVLRTARRGGVEGEKRDELLVALAHEVLFDLLAHAHVQHIALLVLW